METLLIYPLIKMLLILFEKSKDKRSFSQGLLRLVSGSDFFSEEVFRESMVEYDALRSLCNEAEEKGVSSTNLKANLLAEIRKSR